MARNQNTFEKQRREMEKRRKAEEKRAKRRDRKANPATNASADDVADNDESSQD